jgi:hypothetical protein
MGTKKSKELEIYNLCQESYKLIVFVVPQNIYFKIMESE